MRVIAFIGCLLILLVSPLSATDITFPFTSTFNCTESTGASWESLGDITGCTGWLGFQVAQTPTGGWSRVGYTADNYSGGGGGGGYGSIIADGENAASSTIGVTFAAQSELYIRWYMKYPTGFAWSGGDVEYQKIWYLNSIAADNRMLVFQLKAGDDIGYWLVGTDGTNVDADTGGWVTINGGTTGDGNWHCYETHVIAGNPGTLQVWVDGEQVLSDATQNVGATPTGWSMFEWFTNAKSPANSGDVYISVDDVAMQTTGPIGCIGAGSSASTTTGCTISGASMQ